MGSLRHIKLSDIDVRIYFSLLSAQLLLVYTEVEQHNHVFMASGPVAMEQITVPIPASVQCSELLLKLVGAVGCSAHHTNDP